MSRILSNQKSDLAFSNETSFEICLATTVEEKEEIFMFRYQIYIEEMSKRPKDVDYKNKLISDEMDNWALLLYAKVGDELVATMRVNIGKLKDFPRNVVTFLSLESFQQYRREQEAPFAFVTKLMVAPTYRSSPILYLLMAKCYDLCCQQNVDFIFGICNFHLLPLYEQMGCRRYFKNFLLPGYGLAVPIVLIVGDIQHFRAVRSPLYRIARKRGLINTETVNWFERFFPNNLTIVNSQLVTKEELWMRLCRKLDSLPTSTMEILQGLTQMEAIEFIHNCGVLVQCEPGDIITIQGEVSYTYNILVSGKLKSLTFRRPSKEYVLPGQHFGKNGLTEHNKHTEDIAAYTFSEILILSGISFQKFFRSHSDIAFKIIRNTSSQHPFSIK